MVALQIINQFIYPLLYVSNAVVFLSSIAIIGLGASPALALLNSCPLYLVCFLELDLRRGVADRRQ